MYYIYVAVNGESWLDTMVYVKITNHDSTTYEYVNWNFVSGTMILSKSRLKVNFRGKNISYTVFFLLYE